MAQTPRFKHGRLFEHRADRARLSGPDGLTGGDIRLGKGSGDVYSAGYAPAREDDKAGGSR
jgi:hypothetical protein